MKRSKMRVGGCIALCLAMLTLQVGCRPRGQGTQIDMADAVERTDFTSVYDMIGRDVTIDMVEERDGLAYVTVDGVEYELGMDFLSMAMVYNTRLPEGSSDYETEKEVYDEWWRLYVMRWNSVPWPMRRSHCSLPTSMRAMSGLLRPVRTVRHGHVPYLPYTVTG